MIVLIGVFMSQAFPQINKVYLFKNFKTINLLVKSKEQGYSMFDSLDTA